MAILNLSAMLWPSIPRSYYVLLVAGAVLANVVVAMVVLNRVEPTTDDDEALTAFTAKWIRRMVSAFVALPVMLGFAGWLNSQFAPFYLCGLAFLLVAAKVPAIAVDKRLAQLRGAERPD